MHDQKSSQMVLQGIFQGFTKGLPGTKAAQTNQYKGKKALMSEEEELRKELSNKIYGSLDDVEWTLQEALKKYWDNPNKVIQLALYPWMEYTSN